MGPPTSVGGSHPHVGGLVFSMFMFYDHVVITLCMLLACIYIYASDISVIEGEEG